MDQLFSTEPSVATLTHDGVRERPRDFQGQQNLGTTNTLSLSLFIPDMIGFYREIMMKAGEQISQATQDPQQSSWVSVIKRPKRKPALLLDTTLIMWVNLNHGVRHHPIFSVP